MTDQVIDRSRSAVVEDVCYFEAVIAVLHLSQVVPILQPVLCPRLGTSDDAHFRNERPVARLQQSLFRTI